VAMETRARNHKPRGTWFGLVCFGSVCFGLVEGWHQGVFFHTDICGEAKLAT
jgi:hypothetical protein